MPGADRDDDDALNELVHRLNNELGTIAALAGMLVDGLPDGEQRDDARAIAAAAHKAAAAAAAIRDRTNAGVG